MKKYDEIKVKVYKKKIIVMSLLIIFIIGIIFGSIYISILDNHNKKLVIDSVKNYIYSFNKIDFSSRLEIFKNSLFKNLSFFISIWLLGILIIGLPVIVIMIFTKAFVTGFSISSLFAVYKFKGLLGILFYIFPSNIIFILYALFLGAYSIDISIKLFKHAFKKQNFNFNYYMNKYIFLLLISILLSVILALFDAFLSPVLFKLFTNIIK